MKKKLTKKEKRIQDIQDEMDDLLIDLSERNMEDIEEKDLEKLDEEACRYLNQEEEEEGEFDLYRFNHDDISNYYELKRELKELK